MENPNRNSLCIFCYKKPGLLSSSSESLVNSQFISLLSRYLNLTSELNSNPDTALSPVVCDDCSHLGSSFCDLYFQLEMLRMKVNLKVDKICDIMLYARRIPSRYMTFKEQFEEVSGTQKQGGLDELKTIQDFRKVVIKHGKRKLKFTKPQVLLRRLDQQERVPQPPTNPLPVNTMEKPEQKIIAHQQFMALFAVMNLSALNVDVLHSQSSKSTSTASTQTLDNPNLSTELEEDSFQLPKKVGDELQWENPNRDPLELEPEEESQPASYNNYDENPENCGDFVETVYEKEATTTNSSIEVYLDVDEDEADDDTEDLGVGMPFSLFSNEDKDNDGLDVDEEMEDAPSPPSSSEDEESEKPGEAEIESEEEQEDLKDSVNCEKCGLQLECEAALEKHRVLTHRMTKYVRCPICHLMFDSFSHYKRHRTVRRATNKCLIIMESEKSELVPASAPEYPYDGLWVGGGTFFCRKAKCYEVFSSEQKLKIHLKTHGVWKCSCCSKTYSKAHHLAWHEVEVHKNKELLASSSFVPDILHRCNRCKATFGMGHKLTQHFLEKHLNLNQVVLDAQPESTSKSKKEKPQSKGTRKKTDNNVAMGAKGIPRECPICKISLPFCETRKVLQDHVKKWHYVGDMDPEVIYKCEICKAPFTTGVFLSKHFLAVHKKRNRK